MFMNTSVITLGLYWENLYGVAGLLEEIYSIILINMLLPPIGNIIQALILQFTGRYLRNK